MNINIGSQQFIGVEIPILWGSRVVLQDREGRLSVVALDGDSALIEILGDEPAPGVRYELVDDGYKIFSGETELYSFNPESHILTGITIRLPECEISKSDIRIGTNSFSNNSVVGFGVGISVTENGIGIGAPVPSGLAKLAF